MKRIYQKIFICNDLDHADLHFFLNKWTGKTAEPTVKVIRDDKPEYWQHKYLNGCVIPALAEESFSGDVFLCTLEMKKRFLKIDCCGYEEVPEKHRDERTMFIFDSQENLVGYIPSRANIDPDEMKRFILDVEGLLFETQASLNKNAYEIRKKAEL
jgi:hypothetical protein